MLILLYWHYCFSSTVFYCYHRRFLLSRTILSADKIGRFLHDRRQIFVGRFYWQRKSANFVDRLTPDLESESIEGECCTVASSSCLDDGSIQRRRSSDADTTRRANRTNDQPRHSVPTVRSTVHDGQILSTTAAVLYFTWIFRQNYRNYLHYTGWSNTNVAF